jgi:hypothetical protein
VVVEGWTPEHDAGRQAELAHAGASYALVCGGIETVAYWPWEEKYWKPTGDAVRDLVKAGALIAAAIDAELAAREDDK